MNIVFDQEITIEERNKIRAIFPDATILVPKLKSYLECLEILKEEFGDDLFDICSDSVVPGVCRYCGHIHESCEPDATENWCPNCEKSNVISGAMLIMNGAF